MRFIAFAVLLCISIAPFLSSSQPAPSTCETNACALQGSPYPPELITDTLSGSGYLLSVAETVTNLGTSYWEFIDNSGSPNQISYFLSQTLSPSLNLAGINDSILQPFYPEIFGFADELVYLLFRNISDPIQQANDLVDLLFRATSLAINITREVDNSTDVEFILELVEGIIHAPDFQYNASCIFEQIFTDETVQDLLANLQVLEDLALSTSIVRPILEVFRSSYEFQNKFSELRYLLPSSYEITLCYDAALANIVCPGQSRYCQSICGETLEYCTALLSQSLRDLSDVLDSLVILTVGYINSDQFEGEFYQIRQTVLYVVNSTLGSISEFDVIYFVNQTITECNLLPIVAEILDFLNVFPPNTTITVDELGQILYFYLDEALSNFTIDVPSVIYTLDNALQIDNLRNLTAGLYYLPDGALLDGILSLGISNLLRFSPPFGCGELATYYSNPFSFPEYYPFFSNCYDGPNTTYPGNQSYYPNYYFYTCGYYSGQCSFSYQDLMNNNRAAQRTCSFTYENFQNAGINTATNLCNILTTLYPESIGILTDAVQAYNKLPFCRDFIVEPTTCVSNECTINGPDFLYVVVEDTVSGSDYLLNVTETVTTIGSSVWDFIDNTSTPISELLDATLSPSLTYLAGVNDSLLQPFYPEIFDIVDKFFYFLYQDISDPAQLASDLVYLLSRAAYLAIEITREVTNDTEVDNILYIVETVLSTPYLQSNITCVLEEVFSDPSVQELFGSLTVFQNLTQYMGIARPILQVFSQSYLFQSKFYELRSLIPDSEEATLCVDAVLANLVCPFESRYCDSLCGDTLEYCTALLSQSLNDLSDVLDSVVILTVGYINSDQFEVEFNQLRQDVLYVVEGSLFAVSGFDIVDFANQTILECNFVPLAIDILQLLNVLPPNATLSVPAIEQMILYYANESQSNLTNIDISSVFINVENFLQLDALRSLTSQLSFLPNGFLLDGILSLGISNLLRFRPPLGCGELSPYQQPLSFPEFYPFFYSCFDGTLSSVGGNNDNYYSYSTCGVYDTKCNFSYYDLLTNRAAQRTCSFTLENFDNAVIDTPTNLCSVFMYLYPESITLLQSVIASYPVLPFCSDFIIGIVIPTPVDPPVVSFPQAVVTSMVGQAFEYPCTVVGVNTSVTISSNSSSMNQVFAESIDGGRFNLLFTPNAPGTFEFICSATNPGGSDSVSVILKILTLDDVLDIINDIPLDEPLEVSEAQDLISVLTSAVTSNITDDDEAVIRLIVLADLALNSLTDNRNVSLGDAEGLLILFNDIGGLTTPNDTTETPPADVNFPLGVPLGLQRQADALEQIGLNLVANLLPDAPPVIIVSDSSILTVVAVTAVGNDDIPINFGMNSGASVSIRGSFPAGAVVSVSSSVVMTTFAVDTTSGNFQPTLNLQLASDLINLDILVGGTPQTDFSNNPPTLTFTLPVNPSFVLDCQSIDDATGVFVGGVITDLTGEVVVCRPPHLTSFGVLVRARDFTISEAETLALSIISYILLSISFIFLIVSIVIFIISYKKFFKVETNILYFNYAISLALATGVFIFGIQSAKDSPAGCSIVTFLLHYFWLTVFSWSFAISIFMVYILFFGVVQRRRIWWVMMIIGWGLPFPIVVITAAIGLSRGVAGYVTIGDHCFISYQDGLIWGFFVPLILLVVAAAIAGVLSVIKIFLTVRGKGDQVDELDSIKKTALTIVVLLPVLSIPWILGIINAFITAAIATTIIEWVTILLTAPTGALFFFLVVLRNAQVQESIFRKEKAYPTVSQTSGTTASRFTMPSKAKQDNTLQREEPTAITNPAYETASKAPDVTKDTVTENVYSAVAPPAGEGKSYQSIEPENPPENPPESPSKKYSQIEKHYD